VSNSVIYVVVARERTLLAKEGMSCKGLITNTRIHHHRRCHWNDVAFRDIIYKQMSGQHLAETG
jgi:hypothetical protein